MGILNFLKQPQKRFQSTILIIASKVFVGVENYPFGNGNAT